MINTPVEIGAGTEQMKRERDFEKIAISIASLGRSQVESRIKNFKGSFKFDFTDEYLASQTLDRLRHILFAAITTKLRKKAN